MTRDAGEDRGRGRGIGETCKRKMDDVCHFIIMGNFEYPVVSMEKKVNAFFFFNRAANKG